MGAAGPSLSTGHGDLGGWAGALGGLPAEAPGWEVRGAQLGRHPAEAPGWEVRGAQLGRHPAEAPGWEVRGAQLGRHPAEAPGWEVRGAQLGRHPAEAPGWKVRGAVDELPGLALGVEERVAGPPARRAADPPPYPKVLRPTKQYIYSATFNKVVCSETSK